MKAAKQEDGLKISERGAFRRLPGARVEEVTDRKTGQVGEVRLDKGVMKFYGVALDEVAEGKDGSSVRAWVVGQISRSDAFQWTPVIEVAYTAPGRDYVSRRANGRSEWREVGFVDADKTKVEIGIDADRYYIAKGPSGKWRRIEWGDRGTPSPAMGDFDAIEDRDSASFVLPWTDRDDRYGSRERTIVAYSEETWLGLLAMLDVLKQGRQRVLELMRADAELSVFAEVGAGRLQSLLASPAPTEPAHV